MDYLHWIFLALYMTLAVAAMVTILLDNRQPAKTMAWVLVLMFLPAGLVLYQVANGGLGLLQQWYMLRKYGEPKAKAA